MRRKILSLVLCFCMVLSLLPMSALAAGPSVTIGDVSLTSSKYYTVSGTTVTELDSAPDSGGYLYYTLDGTNATLAVTGDVTFTKAAGQINPILLITGCTLTLTGSGNLTLSATRGSAVYGDDGSLVTNDYTGNINFTAEPISASGNAVYGCIDLRLITSGALTLSGGSTGSGVYHCSGDITLEGETVSLTGGGYLAQSTTRNVSITAKTGDLLLSGSGSLPLLEAGSSGTGNVTLSVPNGAISVKNTGSGVAVNGNLSADAGGDVTVESAGHHAVVGSADISTDGGVAITSGSSDAHSAVTGTLTVTKAASVTVTSAGSNPTVVGATDIIADGDISIKNTGSGMAVGNTLTATSTNGLVTVEGKNASAPAIAGSTMITAAQDIMITSASTLDIGGAATLNAPNGMVIRSTSAGSTVTTADGGSYAYGGDVETSGLNISGKDASGNADATYTAPTEVTRYKAGNGYILYTPAVTGDNAANAKLELHGASISTTNATAISLPSDAPVKIVVASDSSIQAGGSGNVIATNGQSLSVIGDGNLTLAGPYYGINVNGTGVVNINTTGDLTFDTASRPIDTSGGITVSAKSITSKSGYNIYSGGAVSLTATEGDISLTTKNSFMGAVNCSSSVSLTANKGAVTIVHSDNASGGYALNGTAATVSAFKDVTITTSRGGIDASSGAVSVTSQSGSIQMDCAMDQCVSASGTVALNAAKDITLNDSSTSSTAISATSRAVNVTAGGKLSSTSAYGFQVGALTIKANEVSIEGTTQDGIQAGSVSITNTEGGNCINVSVTATSSSDNWAAINSPDVIIKADELFICGNGSAKAIKANGAVTIGDAGMIVGAIDVSDTSGIDSDIMCAANGGDKSDGLNLTTPPTETTVYTADKGYVLFAPASATAPATLTLHNATIYNTTAINDETGTGIALPDGAITFVVEGTNTVGAQYTNAISGSDTDVVLSGSGVLNVGYKGIALKSTAANPHTFTKGTNVTFNGIVHLYDNLDESGAANTNTVYGSVTLPSGAGFLLDGALAITQGATMTIPQGVTLDLKNTTAITSNGTIVNNGTVLLPDGTDAATIKALQLTGAGIVEAGSQSYTNDGAAVTMISGDLDLSAGDHSGATLADDGYTFSNNILALGNVYIKNGLILPCDTAVTINTTASSSISGGITAATDAGGYHHPMALTFTGTAPLTINGGISGGVNGDTVTVQDGAQVTLNGYISIGDSGTDGTLTVTGAGTVLDITSDSAYGAMCDTVHVQNGAHLTAHSEGSYGLEALAGGVHVTGGSTLTVGCEYGVYIIDGSFEVDDSSTFTANASVAAVCVVDTNNAMSQDQALAVSSSLLPSGTQKTSTIGDTVEYGYKYDSFASSSSTLAATDENNSPATLAGALGTLTLKKASTPAGGGSGSTSYTLTFETNGGSAIEKLSKTSGTAIDLSAYKPTRDGYDFDGWYSDTALATKVTGVTLTKNTTVYAKWTEKSTNPFADVSDSDYYSDAVLWAVKNGVTGGTSDTAFSPDMTCTRAQMVTFLWRAQGSPEPTSKTCPFTDVAQGAYYYEAVLWAVEKGITAGTSATTFSPDDTVTRGQAVTFLWRAAGKPEKTSANPFSDVTKGAYYYNAVLWAMEKGVTQGTSVMTFSPNIFCTRVQIVTFLYRYAGE